MGKFDLKKEYKELFNPSSSDFSYVKVPEFQFLMIDGKGDPNTSQEYQDAVETLYGIAYKIKFLSKILGNDYVVSPLEGLWWADDPSAFTTSNKAEWEWTMMIMQPDWVNKALFLEGMAEVGKSKNLPALSKIRLEKYDEGEAIQILYIGPYADEAPVIAAMHEKLSQDGYSENGKHHEIYLNDPRRTSPEKLKTVIRQPVKIVV